MEGEDHVLLVFVKHQEIALYHKAWPNHVIVGLPASADSLGLGAARYYIKVFNSCHCLHFVTCIRGFAARKKQKRKQKNKTKSC